MILRLFLALGLAVMAAACASTETAPPVSATPAPGSGMVSRPALVGPAACTKPIGDYERVIDDDVTTGHLSKPVYDRIVNDLTGVRASCAAGRTGPALADLAAVKARYGYR
ncbi:MAG TPA: hypothetical protein VGQ97_10575 [Xanthobacteraceae bacterium]|nr:hypothetical protein [Xanthobacteraceae bacterium]